MKKLCFLIVLIGLTFASFGQKTKPKLVRHYWDYNSTQIQKEGHYYADDFNGQTTMEHGLWRYWDRQGNLEEERNYVKGVLHGEVILYYSNGKPKQKGYFKEGLQDSLFVKWHQNGVIEQQGYYKNDRAIGDWKYFYANGYHMMEEKVEDSVAYVLNFWKQDSTQTLTDGNGRTFIYYQSTGHLQEFYTYKDGLKNGDFEEFTAYGNFFAKGQYVNNEKHGDWIYWYYTGKIDRQVSYSNGVLNGKYTKNYDNGKVNITGEYANGKKLATGFGTPM